MALPFAIEPQDRGGVEAAMAAAAASRGLLVEHGALLLRGWGLGF